jgi:hypothetical protein
MRPQLAPWRSRMRVSTRVPFSAVEAAELLAVFPAFANELDGLDLLADDPGDDLLDVLHYFPALRCASTSSLTRSMKSF